LESISAIFRIANFKITNVLSKTGLETQRAGSQRRNVMISHSAVETPEQKKFFTPARVRKHVPFTQQLFGCPEAEAVEVTQLNYQVHGLPAGSKERNDAHLDHVAACRKYDRLNPWTKPGTVQANLLDAVRASKVADQQFYANPTEQNRAAMIEANAQMRKAVFGISGQ
jgi:hypothetical protein